MSITKRAGPARVIQVIETTLTRRGEGVIGDPIRIITEYWDMDGNKLCEVDPITVHEGEGEACAIIPI